MSEHDHFDYDVIIAGGGPAGSSAAIHLALRGARVLLVEQKKFPRPKLCGEFISPECSAHFERLGVADDFARSGPSAIDETVFYAKNGRHVSVPSKWFGSAGVALGLSRAEMDERLLRHASHVGVDVREDAPITNVLIEADCIRGASIKQNGKGVVVRAPIVIDATGRARILSRLIEGKRTATRRSMVAFKAHFSNTRVAASACEIYFYRGGYGGLNRIENDLSNLCFIVNSRDARAFQSNPDRVVREIVCRNQRAAATLANANRETDWLAVSLEGFGRHSPAPANGLLAIGDAASFIDPFTGSGMLMALESGELAANAIGARLNSLKSDQTIDQIRESYRAAYHNRFDSRLRICSLIRRAAFAPGLAEVAIRFFSSSITLRRALALATRSQTKRNLSSAHSLK